MELTDIIKWIDIEEDLPPKNEYIWLCNINDKTTGHEFVVEFDLTTQHFQRKWTHWTLAKIPYSKIELCQH